MQEPAGGRPRWGAPHAGGRAARTRELRRACELRAPRAGPPAPHFTCQPTRDASGGGGGERWWGTLRLCGTNWMREVARGREITRKKFR